MNILYNYDFNKHKYWIDLELFNTDDFNTKVEKENSAVDEKPISFYNESGQQISNYIFYVEGIDSKFIFDKLEEILNKNPESQKDIFNLQDEDFIATYLLKYIIQNNHCKIEQIIQCLDWLFKCSQYLSKKIGLSDIFIKKNKTKVSQNVHISRCSYKFCTYKDCCNYNYPDTPKKTFKKKNRGCYADHYVHNKVSQDISSLLKYFNKLFTSDTDVIIRNNKEVVKCITTIVFVIKHMYDELWSIYKSTNNTNYEVYHKNII